MVKLPTDLVFYDQTNERHQLFQATRVVSNNYDLKIKILSLSQMLHVWNIFQHLP